MALVIRELTIQPPDASLARNILLNSVAMKSLNYKLFPDSSDNLAYVVTSTFKNKISLISSEYIIASDVQNNAQVKLYVRLFTCFIISSVFVLNFMLPEGRTNCTETARTILCKEPTRCNFCSIVY